jgi:hypothetical protein
MIQVATRLGTRRIFFQVSPGTRLYDLFATKYTSTPSFPVIVLNLGANIPSDKLAFTFADIDIF